MPVHRPKRFKFQHFFLSPLYDLKFLLQQGGLLSSTQPQCVSLTQSGLDGKEKGGQRGGIGREEGCRETDKEKDTELKEQSSQMNRQGY